MNREHDLFLEFCVLDEVSLSCQVDILFTYGVFFYLEQLLIV